MVAFFAGISTDGSLAWTSASFKLAGLLCPKIILVSARILVAEDLVKRSQFPFIIIRGESKPGLYVETKNRLSSSFVFSSLYSRLSSRVFLQTHTIDWSRMSSGYPRLLKCSTRCPMCLIKSHELLHMRLTL